MTEKVWPSSRQLEHVTGMPEISEDNEAESGGAASHLAFFLLSPSSKDGAICTQGGSSHLSYSSQERSSQTDIQNHVS